MKRKIPEMKSKVIPQIGLYTTQATPRIKKCRNDPQTNEKMMAAIMTILARSHPTSGIQLSRAMIGEKSR
jgi:hypothetical protein